MNSFIIPIKNRILVVEVKPFSIVFVLKIRVPEGTVSSGVGLRRWSSQADAESRATKSSIQTSKTKYCLNRRAVQYSVAGTKLSVSKRNIQIIYNIH